MGDGDALARLAVAALGEVTDPATVGPLVDAVETSPGVVDLGFACLLPGYPDWRWTVSTARVDGAEPTVLEVELLPGDGSLLAPPWVPWDDRLAEYRRTHGAVAEDAEDDDAEDAEDDLEDGDLDDDADDPDLDDDADDDLDDGVDVESADEAAGDLDAGPDDEDPDDEDPDAAWHGEGR